MAMQAAASTEGRNLQVHEQMNRLHMEISRAVDAVAEIEVRLKDVVRSEGPETTPELNDVSQERVAFAIELAERADTVGFLATRLVSVLGRLEL
jgi:hypothetical protein